MASTGPMDEFDEQYEVFCDLADTQGSTRAAGSLRRLRIPEETVERLVDRFERHKGAVRGMAPAHVRSGGRFDWYTGPRPGDRCWPALEEMLRGRGWEEANIRRLDEASTGIVGLLDHPATLEFSTRGLVVGHVQSGKTSNFTAVMAKAADRGYRLFIVLGGIHNELRRQTQNRLLGQLYGPNKEFWQPLTEADHDFVRPAAGAQSYFGRFGEQRMLAVVKKNPAVLRKLIRWLHDAETQLRDIPALVIDDEADQAGVATKTINPLILQLLGTLPRVGYVGYTATPFANLLIDPGAGDLYPRHFIVDLPKPDGHFGTEVIFGREPLDHEDPEQVDDGMDMVRIVPPEEVPLVRPGSRDEVEGFTPQIGGELRKAVLWFWSATAARRVRGTGSPHSTMLVHTSVRVSVHESFKAPLAELKAQVTSGLGLQDRELLAELEAMWSGETARVPPHEMGEQGVAFPDLLEHLPRVVEETRILLDNSASDERLGYESGAVTAIAVGGNTLSRGLTLEGLVVSYFVRSVSAYDTLLQMGRWFGYRDGYADLPRIWMTSELQEWFRHIAGVEAEMREDIRRYMVEDESPETFAVRIRAHPALRVTAAAKMRDAAQVASAYGGMRVQTRYFHADDEGWLLSNQRAARALIGRVSGSLEPTEPRKGTILWRGAPVEDVLRFLEDYNIHERSLDSDPRLLQKYIRERNGKAALTSWNVAIVGNPGRDVGSFEFAPGVDVGKVTRAKLAQTVPAAADIKTLMSRRDAAVDLEAPSQLSESAIKELRVDQLPTTGLLVLYAIDRKSATVKKSREPLNAEADVIGLGLVFPEPPRGQDSSVYYAADLSRIRTDDGYVEEEDLSVLEQE